MEASPVGMGDGERGRTPPAGDRHELGAGDSCDDGIQNSEGCELPKGLVSDVPDPPNHKLTSDELTDSAVDVTSTDTNQPPSSGFFTGDLLAMLMSNMKGESGVVSVDPDQGDQNVVDTSRVADAAASDCDASTGVAKRASETSFAAKKITADDSVANVQLDDGKTRSTLKEQRCDSPSSGISSCSVDTGGDVKEKLPALSDVGATDTTPQQPVESTSDPCTVGNNPPSPVEVDVAQCDSRYSGDDEDPSFVLPGEAFNVLRIASSKAAATSVDNHSLHSTTSDAVGTAPKCPSSSTHKLKTSSEAPDVRHEADTGISLDALSCQYGVDISGKLDNAGRVTSDVPVNGTGRVTSDAPVNGSSVDQFDHRRVRLASSLSSDSDTIPCGARHSTSDGKQYVNLPMTPLHRDRDAMHKDKVLVRSATVKQGGRPGAHIKVQVELSDSKRDKLNRYDVHRLLERGGGRWQCDRHKGPHIVLMTLLCMPVALVASTVFCLYMGTVCWYNVLCYLYVEGPALHKALFCPLLVLAYPVVVFATAFGVGLYASIVQVSWTLLKWQQTVTDYEKGFYGWLCSTLGVVQCAPYGVIVLNTDVAQTLEPTQEETDV